MSASRKGVVCMFLSEGGSLSKVCDVTLVVYVCRYGDEGDECKVLEQGTYLLHTEGGKA